MSVTELICSHLKEEIFPDYFVWETIIFNLLQKFTEQKLLLSPFSNRSCFSISTHFVYHIVCKCCYCLEDQRISYCFLTDCNSEYHDGLGDIRLRILRAPSSSEGASPALQNPGASYRIELSWDVLIWLSLVCFYWSPYTLDIEVDTGCHFAPKN